MEQGPGYWALTRYADVMQVSRHPDTFRSAPTTNIGDIPPEVAEFLGSMINMDAPPHTKLRLIVNRGFTPRRSPGSRRACYEPRSRRSSTRSRQKGECDFVAEIAAALPLQIICDMMGIPASGLRVGVRARRTSMLGVGDPEYGATIMEALMAAGMELFQYAPGARPTGWPTRATTSRRS